MNICLDRAASSLRGETSDFVLPDFDSPQDRNQVEAPIIARALRDDEFRSELLANPKIVMERELGELLGKTVTLPADFEVRIVEETPNVAYIVLPAKVPATSPEFAPGDSDLDLDKGVTFYCTTIGCKPGFSC